MSWGPSQANALRAVFDALDAAGIRWLVLRNHEGLPEENRSKDVDLGVDRGNFERVQGIISRVMSSVGFDRVSVDVYQYVRCLTFFSLQIAAPQSIKIDLLDGFVFRGAQVFGFNQLYSDRRRYGNFNIPSVTDNAVMLWLKPLLTGKIVKQKYQADIINAARSEPQSFQTVLARILPSTWAERVWAKIEAEDISGTIPFYAGLRRAVWWKAFRINPVATIGVAVSHVVSEIVRRLRRRPGTMFSVLGPDGAGKTTFIDHFSRKLAELQVKDLNSTTVRHFRPHLLPNINHLLTGKRQAISDFNQPHRAPPVGVVSSFLRVCYYWTDYVLGYWIKIRPHCIRGRIIIFDRYFYDFLVDPRRSRLSLPKWLPKLLVRMTPEPDLVFFLDAEARQIYARKQELTETEINRQLGAYRLLVAGNPERFVRLDAVRSPGEMAEQALRAVVERLSARIG